MEKYNETDLMKEIKRCAYEQDYEQAVQLAQTLDLNKMKNVSYLCLLGEIFLHEGENDLAEKVLLKAYEKMPKGRRALDMLTSLYIDKGSCDSEPRKCMCQQVVTAAINRFLCNKVSTILSQSL